MFYNGKREKTVLKLLLLHHLLYLYTLRSEKDHQTQQTRS